MPEKVEKERMGSVLDLVMTAGAWGADGTSLGVLAIPALAGCVSVGAVAICFRRAFSAFTAAVIKRVFKIGGCSPNLFLPCLICIGLNSTPSGFILSR